ncbi:chemotaxis protein CheW [Virgisporangium aurantiacum]|uniref:chemotaxis protein CheW n=1 Tax=Virgisporangium aurantiacum TaxID=175570 RepID=UPI001950B259|nr:chemotaxis protein CheW [Virgisporangium aurantiacum]
MGGQSLVFRADTHLAAIGLEHVTEVLRPLPVEGLAGVPPYVRGICVLRGRPVPVVDIGLLLGGERLTGEYGAARFVGVRTGPQTAVLAVDTVVGIRDIPLDRLHDLSSVTGSVACTAVGAIGREPLLLLETGRVIPDSVWDALEAA